MFDAVTKQLKETWAVPMPHEPQARRARVLIPISGGPNAGAALGVLPGLANPENEIAFLHVRTPRSAPDPELRKSLLDTVAGLPNIEFLEAVSEDPEQAIIDASKSVDLIVLGASVEHPFGPALLEVARNNKCPTIVIRREAAKRHCSREGPRAFVIAESSPEGMLGLERAVRWAKAGSASQEVLLIAPRDQVAGPGHPVATNEEVRREILSQPRDLVVIACDPSRGDGRWVSEVTDGLTCSVVCVFASVTGPRTRRRKTGKLLNPDSVKPGSA